jgi:hypothetical protein
VASGGAGERAPLLTEAIVIAFRTRPAGTPPLRAIWTPQCGFLEPFWPIACFSIWPLQSGMRANTRESSNLRERHAELSEMKSPEAATLLSEIKQALGHPVGNELELIKRAEFLIKSEMHAMAA